MTTSITEPCIRLSKFDVAERQLLQAIRMFFAEEDAVSIHTLSEAAAQVIHDIGKKTGTMSIWRDSARIAPERMAEWLAAVFSSRNFFKHADRDPGNTHEFKLSFNDFSILDAVLMYATLKKHWTPETLLFITWFGIAYPDLLLEETDLHKIITKLQDNHEAKADNKKYFSRAITALRTGVVSTSNVNLDYGVPTDKA